MANVCVEETLPRRVTYTAAVTRLRTIYIFLLEKTIRHVIKFNVGTHTTLSRTYNNYFLSLSSCGIQPLITSYNENGKCSIILIYILKVHFLKKSCNTIDIHTRGLVIILLLKNGLRNQQSITSRILNKYDVLITEKVYKLKYL